MPCCFSLQFGRLDEFPFTFLLSTTIFHAFPFPRFPPYHQITFAKWALACRVIFSIYLQPARYSFLSSPHPTTHHSLFPSSIGVWNPERLSSSLFLSSFSCFSSSIPSSSSSCRHRPLIFSSEGSVADSRPPLTRTRTISPASTLFCRSLLIRRLSSSHTSDSSHLSTFTFSSRNFAVFFLEFSSLTARLLSFELHNIALISAVSQV